MRTWVKLSSNRFFRLQLCAIFALVGGCGTCDLEDSTPVLYTGGTTNVAGTHYESSPLNGPFLHFPGGRVFELVHGLQTAPDSVHAYLAFSEGGAATGSVSEAAGNQVLVECVDDTIIRVRADTCEREYFLRVEASIENDVGGQSVTPCEPVEP